MSNKHPPECGKLGVSLALAKRAEGVTQLEALSAGGGSRLAPQVHSLKKKGHIFSDERVTGTRYKRYWWVRWEPPVEAAND